MDCSTDFYSQLSGLPKEQQHKQCTEFLRNSSSDDKVLLNRAVSFKGYVVFDLHTQEGFEAGAEGFKKWCRKHQGTLFGKNPHEEGKSLNREPERMLAVSDVLVAVHNDSTIIIKPTSIGQLSAIYSRGAWDCWEDVIMPYSKSFMEQGFTSPDALWGQLQLRTIAKADKLFQDRAELLKWDSKRGRLINHTSRKLNAYHYLNAAHIVKLQIELEAGLVVSLV
jgi:hypothetical protein